jgi:hypothetical protein
MVYEIDGGYLVQLVPRNDGQMAQSPRFVATPQEIGEYLLLQRAIEELDK